MLHIYLFGLFYEVLSDLYYTASNCRAINEFILEGLSEAVVV